MDFSFSSDLNFNSVVIDAVAMPPSIEDLSGLLVCTVFTFNYLCGKLPNRQYPRVS